MRPIERQHFRPIPAGIIFCVALLATMFLSVLLSAVVPAIVRATSADAEASQSGADIIQWCYAFLAPVFYILAVIVGGRADGTDVVAALGIRRRPALWQVGLTIALAILCIFAFLPLATWIQQLFALMGYNPALPYPDYTSNWGNMLLGLAALSVMPALGEEVLCRGLAFGALRQKGTQFGILMSALLFALLHGSPIQLIHQFLIGAIMALLVHLTRTVWTSVIFHFCNNAAVILYEFVKKQAGWTYTLPWWGFLIMFAVGVPSVVALLMVFCHISLSKSTPREDLPMSEERLSWQNRLRRVLDVHGEYLPKVPGNAQMGTMYAAFGLVAVIWLINTITGWLA